MPRPGAGCLFFDCRTLPAWRGASKRSRPGDHGPLQDPRDRLAGRGSAFLTRRSFRAGLFTPSKQYAVTWRHTQGETPMTTPFKHENVIKIAGVLGVAPELRLTAN